MANKKPKTTTKSSTVDIKVGRYHKTTHRTKVTTTKIGPKVQLTKAQRTWIAIGLIALPVIVGLIASALTRDIMESFGALNQPPFAPPAWLFPVAWTLLYILMGVASFLIWRQDPRTKEGKKLRRAELIIYFVQLALNFCWTLLFFRFGLRYFAFAWLLVMWALILTLIIMTAKNSKAAMWCLIPYILWCTFAAVLNISIAILN